MLEKRGIEKIMSFKVLNLRIFYSCKWLINYVDTILYFRIKNIELIIEHKSWETLINKIPSNTSVSDIKDIFKISKISQL